MTQLKQTLRLVRNFILPSLFPEVTFETLKIWGTINLILGFGLVAWLTIFLHFYLTHN